MDSASSSSSCSVIVVGAGVSGIMAAKTLADNGVKDFVILEASDKIGGRLLTHQFGGLTVETGAGWVQGVGGEQTNPIWELAQKHNLRTCYSDYSNARFNIYDQSGKVLPRSVAAASYETAVKAANQALGLEASVKSDVGRESLSILSSQELDCALILDAQKWKEESFFKCDITIYTKIFLKFPRKFWPTGAGTEFFLYADDKRGYYTFWQHMENAYPGSNILVVTVTNDESKRIEEQGQEQTKAEAMEVLRKMFGNDIPEAEDILVPTWWNNRFQRGSYTDYPILADSNDFLEIRAPVGPIYFTGEHTNEKFNGYVHGAYLAGIDTAKTLLEIVKKNDGRHNLYPCPKSLVKDENLSGGCQSSGSCAHLHDYRKWEIARELVWRQRMFKQIVQVKAHSCTKMPTLKSQS